MSGITILNQISSSPISKFFVRNKALSAVISGLVIGAFKLRTSYLSFKDHYLKVEDEKSQWTIISGKMLKIVTGTTSEIVLNRNVKLKHLNSLSGALKSLAPKTSKSLQMLSRQILVANLTVQYVRNKKKPVGTGKNIDDYEGSHSGIKALKTALKQKDTAVEKLYGLIETVANLEKTTTDEAFIRYVEAWRNNIRYFRNKTPITATMGTNNRIEVLKTLAQIYGQVVKEGKKELPSMQSNVLPVLLWAFGGGIIVAAGLFYVKV